jgi:hypothetical protein
MDRPAHHHDADERTDAQPTAADRATARWGLERVRLVHGPVPDAGGDLARTLQRALRHLPVVMLHDRLLPAGVLVEHLAVGPGGVTVVADASDLTRPLQVELLRGMFGTHAELLWDPTVGDRTAVIEPVRERVAAVRRLLDDYAPVVGALCLADGGPPRHLRALAVDGILIADPKGVAELAAREGDLRDYELATLVDLLDLRCPPALG